MSSGPDWMSVCHAAISLSAEERKDLEKRLASTPDDLELRVKLAGADFLSVDPASLARRAVHLAWLVKHHPDVYLGGFAFVPETEAAREYIELRQLWLDALAARPDDLRVAKAAGSFLSFFDRELAIDVYRRAAAADPENADWHDSLGNLYANLAKWSDDASHALEHAKQAVASYEAVLRLVASDWQQVMARVDIARSAALAKDWSLAVEQARRALVDNETAERTFAYGNVVHWANIVLGRAALARGDVEDAARHLEAAGATPGSPQLNSFGPDWDLAKALLAEGQRGAVVRYIESCKRFWSDRAEQLDEWKAAIERDESPWAEDDAGDADPPA